MVVFPFVVELKRPAHRVTCWQFRLRRTDERLPIESIDSQASRYQLHITPGSTLSQGLRSTPPAMPGITRKFLKIRDVAFLDLAQKGFCGSPVPKIVP
jgi:hypothetical protein